MWSIITKWQKVECISACVLLIPSSVGLAIIKYAGAEFAYSSSQGKDVNKATIHLVTKAFYVRVNVKIRQKNSAVANR
jgi:hypothetical protein